MKKTRQEYIRDLQTVQDKVAIMGETALTSGATHVLQWQVQRDGPLQKGSNPQSLSQFGLGSATRPHEAGFASNRASAMAR